MERRNHAVLVGLWALASRASSFSDRPLMVLIDDASQSILVCRTSTRAWRYGWMWRDEREQVNDRPEVETPNIMSPDAPAILCAPVVGIRLFV